MWKEVIGRVEEGKEEGAFGWLGDKYAQCPPLSHFQWDDLRSRNRSRIGRLSVGAISGSRAACRDAVTASWLAVAV